MFTLTLTKKEVELLKKSMQHCLNTCEKDGVEKGCTDCAAIDAVLKRLP